MALTAYEKLQLASADLNRVQDRIRAFTAQLHLVDFLSGNILTVTTDSTGTATIAHGLRIRPLGFFVTDLQSPYIIYRGTMDDTFITFHSVDTSAAGVSATFKVWVF